MSQTATSAFRGKSFHLTPVSPSDKLSSTSRGVAATVVPALTRGATGPRLL